MRIMNRPLRTGFVLALSTASATAAPVVLDTEQRAVAGVSAAFFVSSDVPHHIAFATDDLMRKTDRAFATVRSVTTFDALVQTRGGVTIPCDVAGTMSARISNALPRVLRLQWAGCVLNVDGVERTYNGPAAVTLVSDSLQPERLASVHFGNASAEFIEQYRFDTPEQIDITTRSANLLLRGDLSSTRAFNGFGAIIGTSSYEIQGYVDEKRRLEFPSGAPSYDLETRTDFARTTIIESRDIAQDGSSESDALQILSGTLQFVRTDPAPYGTTTQGYRFNGLSVSKDYDWNAGAWQLQVNGVVNISWNPFMGAGCANGVYNFRTRAPITRALNSVTLESGELAVNGSAVARFYTAGNVPSRLPTPVNGMLFNLRVDNLGVFNYDTASLPDTFYSVGACNVGL
jgi:hypothetical protein